MNPAIQDKQNLKTTIQKTSSDATCPSDRILKEPHCVNTTHVQTVYTYMFAANAGYVKFV